MKFPLKNNHNSTNNRSAKIITNFIYSAPCFLSKSLIIRSLCLCAYKTLFSHLRMPYVENTRISASHNLHLTTNVLPIEHYVFPSPTNDVLVESSYFQEVRSEVKVHKFRDYTMYIFAYKTIQPDHSTLACCVLVCSV